MTDLAYYDDPTPGAGRRRPRSWWRPDARTLRLDGSWRFRLSETAAGTGEDFVTDAFDDSGWDDIRMPSHWVLEGHDQPIYTNTAYPFPVDPPRTPAANPTGDYRVVFDLPEDWTAPRTVLRFQGVDSCGAVWLNGRPLGHSKGSRLPFEFDVGADLRETGNVLAVRVHRWSSGSYLEDQDMWWLPGIFREVELLERPTGTIDDYFVHASYDHETGAGTLRVDADAPGTVDLPELGVHAATGDEVFLPAVAPWSAETPRLYRGTLSAGGETIELTVGFRTVSIEGGRLLVNGSPVLMRGVNRHEHDPDRGRALDLETMRADILLMKRHNVNAVRTSHYPPHPEFLRLCDEYGLWVVDECDIETHGFIYTGWESNPPADPQWRAALLDRIERMVERDKNRPSVIVWSLGNESAAGETFGEMTAWIRQRDPSRPIHYERDTSYRHSDFYSLMYPSQETLERIGRREEEAPAGVDSGSDDDVRRRGLPFLLCEYAHAMGNGPGSLVDYQRILEAHERFCGAFVWEWIDHGFRRTTADGREYFIHGGDIPVEPNGRTFCIDGLVFPDRTPSPGLLELKKAIEPIEIAIDADAGTVRIRNKHDLRDLAHVRFVWRLERDGEPVADGELSLPEVGPRTDVTVPLPDSGRSSAEELETWLTVSAVLAHDELWAPAGHEIAWGQACVVPRRNYHREFPFRSRVTGGSGALDRNGNPREAGVGSETSHERVETLGPAAFDARTGRLTRFGDLELDGPVLDVWRAPTDNDRGQGALNNAVVGWKALGLDRMLHRVDAVDYDGSSGLTVRCRVAPAGQGIALRTTYAWTVDAADGIRLRVEVEPEGVWTDTPVGHHTVTLPRLGLRMALPGSMRSVDWFGLGPNESYADSHASAKVGRYSASIDELQTPYVVPQENGNHTATRRLDVADADGVRLRVVGSPTFEFAARRWTSEALETAGHQTDLADSGYVWLNLDLAQRGVGSSSCGPALPDRYELPPQPYAFELTFALP